ncbi:glutathione S-transferase N-terminal domain-containing protein [Candidatus Woesearchaeota archaeon]|nr:glutathione S-transferase N-terminal domain-containing protein [Candidatus Woesearchaeota archaeon]
MVEKKAQKKVKVYSTPVCPWCHKAKEFLKEHKIPFQDIDVAADKKAAQEMTEKSGQIGVPVIDIDGMIIVGYDVQALKKALDL